MPEKTTQKEHGKKTSPPSEKEVQPEVVIQIPLAELHPFPDHPFQVQDDDSMRETAESVKAYGVLVPAIVRPREEGGYEIIAGHRRKHACELTELATMPAIVRNMDRDTATIIMVDSNLQRENILPSERAKAYKMKMDATKRRGARTDLTSPNVLVEQLLTGFGIFRLVKHIFHLNENAHPVAAEAVAQLHLQRHIVEEIDDALTCLLLVQEAVHGIDYHGVVGIFFSSVPRFRDRVILMSRAKCEIRQAKQDRGGACAKGGVHSRHYHITQKGAAYRLNAAPFQF